MLLFVVLGFFKQLLQILTSFDLGSLSSLSCLIGSVFVRSGAEFCVESCVYLLVRLTHAGLEEKFCWKIPNQVSNYYSWSLQEEKEMPYSLSSTFKTWARRFHSG